MVVMMNHDNHDHDDNDAYSDDKEEDNDDGDDHHHHADDNDDDDDDNDDGDGEDDDDDDDDGDDDDVIYIYIYLLLLMVMMFMMIRRVPKRCVKARSKAMFLACSKARILPIFDPGIKALPRLQVGPLVSPQTSRKFSNTKWRLSARNVHWPTTWVSFDVFHILGCVFI